MSDLISRQAAIDAVDVILDTARKTDGDLIRRQDAIDAINALHEKPNAWLDSAVDAVMTLPSAQSEIIRCKDCKYWMRAYLSISGKHGCSVMRDYTAPDDYCFKAERKA